MITDSEIEKDFYLTVVKVDGVDTMVLHLKDLGKDCQLMIVNEKNIIDFRKKLAAFINENYPKK